MMEDFFAYIEDPVSRRLMEALAQLMERHPFDQVSTTDLLTRSGVSRSTFYRRYRDKYDLINQNYQLLLDQTISRIPAGQSYKNSFYALYQALKSNPAFFRNALASDETDGLKNYIFARSYEIYETLMRRQGLDMDAPYYKMMLTGYIKGALEVTCIWAERGMKEPIDELFRISFELMPHELQIPLALSYM